MLHPQGGLGSDRGWGDPFAYSSSGSSYSVAFVAVRAREPSEDYTFIGAVEEPYNRLNLNFCGRVVSQGRGFFFVKRKLFGRIIARVRSLGLQ